MRRGDAGVVAFCCDAGPAVGVGHVMRCLALAEELASRGCAPAFVADLDGLGWARERVVRQGFDVLAPASGVDAYVAAVLALRPVAVVLDSYLLSPEVSRRLRASGVPVAAMVDGELRGHEADLYVDQNLGAEDDAVELPDGVRRLAGLEYALLRDDLLRARPAVPREDADVPVPRVFAFFGGTDAFGAGPAVLRALALTGRSFEATVVVGRDDLAAELTAVPLGDGQHVTPIPPTDRLAELVATADVVVAAAGSSTWELLCLGAATAVVRVAANQRIGHDRGVATEAVAGLGALDDLRTRPDAAAMRLARLLTDPAERTRLRRTGWHLVDGRGRRRVADALLALS
ncbi:MAG: hypothetical protein J2P24_03390 [Streptosporangiales bacterium]|nr:hypothetical protein [Streptosporangiales bacterium]MBO0889358.1 hypothetical protein [Acidothermales bacterium]